MLYKRDKRYWMDNVVNGVRYRESLKTTNWQEAKRKEKERLQEIAEGKGAQPGPASRQTFDQAADAYIEARQLHSAEKSCRTDRERSQALRRCFGDTQLRRITAEMIAGYQKRRVSDGVSGRTINLEVGLLRRILKKNKLWTRLVDDVQMLPEKPKEPRVLTPEEKARLLETARSRAEWQLAAWAAVLALNTTMRGCEIRGLRWEDVNFSGRTVTVRRQSTKTDAGARVIPLNAEALEVLRELRERALLVSSTESLHYVFPTCEHGHFDATQPMKGWRTAWRNLTRAAGLEGLRFHDLRHQAITELAEMGLSDQTVMSIAGHVSQRMLAHYSHIRLDAKRNALDRLGRSGVAEDRLPAAG